MTGVALAGLSSTVLPVTIAAAVMPTVIASGKFQGGMTTPTPSGRYTRSLSSPAMRGSRGGSASRNASRP